MFLCGIMFSRFVLYALSCNVVIAYCVFLCFLWLCGQVAVVLGAYIIIYTRARRTGVFLSVYNACGGEPVFHAWHETDLLPRVEKIISEVI